MSSLISRFTLPISRFRLQVSRPLALSLTSFLSLVAYTFGLLVPYSLFSLGLRPLLNAAKLTRDDTLAQANFVLTFASLSALYYLAWRLCRGRQPRAMWIVLLGGAILLNFAMLWLYPIGAADIFDNISRGRITAVHGGNPFYNVPRDFSNDPFLRYDAWPRTRTAYGPLWEMMAAGTSRLVGDDKLANVLGFKLLGLVFYAGCIALIAAILNRHASERALQGVCLFALNPLVIYETAGNGHNDIVMAFFIVLALWTQTRGRFTLAALALTAGALVKFIPLLLLPITITAALRTLPSPRNRTSFLLITSIACATLAVAVYAPFWRGGDPVDFQRREGLFTSSLPTVIQVQLEGPLGVDQSRWIVSRIALVVTGLVIAAAVWRTWVERDWLSPIRASTFVLLFYLLFTCLWFQSWYTLWPLALAAILPEGEMGRIAVLLSYSALWKTIIFDYFIYRGGPLPPRLWRETWLGPATLGVTWSYGAYAFARKMRHRFRR
jgi:hypothetical protein